jgi:1-acyl-sn-glycerol-3-phosphate acyltransferase
MSAWSKMRAVVRLAWFSVASWLVVARGIFGVLSPFPARCRRTAPHTSRWARLGARCLGIRVTRSGPLPPPGSLVVANHFGYIDVITVGGLFPSIFAARHDIRQWPMFGALAHSGATVFINRDSRRASVRGVSEVAAALKEGATVIAFPEGTSSDGTGLLPFRTGMFQAAIDAGVPVVPVAIRYPTVDGKPLDDTTRPVVGWYHSEPFLGHVFALGSHRVIEATVTVGEPILPPHTDRRTLAAEAEARMRALLGLAADAFPMEGGRGWTARRTAAAAGGAES